MADSQNNVNTDFCPKSVSELLNGTYVFVIPSYQRGYRWEEKQVIDLLEDIYKFSKSNQESYYLQPLVVKRCKWKDENGKENDAWEVLDGQQRLTTLYLILIYLFENSLTRSEEKTFTNDKIYKITYTNRPQLNFEDPKPQDNIDSYYVRTAKDSIMAWFERQTQSGNDVETAFKHCLMYSNSKSLVKFIWYEVPETGNTIESIQVFNRLNKGKISLTSSELIKALFIMDSNIISNNDRTKADELVLDFNQMERQFQNNKFWAFISNDNDDYQTRIDVLFDFLTEKFKENEDKDYAYRKFQNLYDYCRNKDSVELDELWKNKNIYSMQDAWKEVVKTYDRLLAWFEDIMYYHYVGFLVRMGNQPREIFKFLSEKKGDSKEWTLDDTKKVFYEKIMDCFKEKDKYLTVESIDGLEYGSDFVFRILLLFNIESCIRKGQRFDFDSFNNEQWDIEHINPQNNASLVERDDRIRWLKNVKFILETKEKLFERKTEAEKLQKECETLIGDYEKSERGIDNKYKDFSKKAMEYFSESNNKSNVIENNDSISNLTLLDFRTNREYQDAPFPYKRYRIVEEDKEGKRFIPVGTRNVFLKYYTNSDKESSFIDALRWTKTDAECYLQEIHKVVDPIFNVFNVNKTENHE